MLSLNLKIEGEFGGEGRVPKKTPRTMDKKILLVSGIVGSLLTATD